MARPAGEQTRVGCLMLRASPLRPLEAFTLAQTRLLTSTTMDSPAFWKPSLRQEMRDLWTFGHLQRTAHPNLSRMAFRTVRGYWSLPPRIQRQRAVGQETCSATVSAHSSTREARFS